MIARLVGRLVERDGARGILDVNGVGYEVFATARDLDAWADADTVTVIVATLVREDAITLFGFADALHRQAFNVLTGVTGIGPRLALAALDTLPLAALAAAVDADDVRALSAIPGVGKKMAARLALELKGKLPVDFVPTATRAARPSAAADMLPLALARLGYTKTEIDRARAALTAQGVADDAPDGERLRLALRVLSGRDS